MTRTLRLAAATVALIAAGCNSNNTGKIVGRWQADVADAPRGPNGPAGVVWEFAEDGSFTVSRVELGPAGPNEIRVASGRYTLGLQDNVAFSNLDPPLEGKTRSSERIVIEGDTMTVGGRGKDRTYKFTRIPQ
jgi:hypothetical protein